MFLLPFPGREWGAGKETRHTNPYPLLFEICKSTICIFLLAQKLLPPLLTFGTLLEFLIVTIQVRSQLCRAMQFCITVLALVDRVLRAGATSQYGKVPLQILAVVVGVMHAQQLCCAEGQLETFYAPEGKPLNFLSLSLHLRLFKVIPLLSWNWLFMLISIHGSEVTPQLACMLLLRENTRVTLHVVGHNTLFAEGLEGTKRAFLLLYSPPQLLT